MRIFLAVIFLAVAILFTGCPKKDAEPKEKVNLTFHVMSKCPYGAQVIKGIKPVLDKLGKAVDFEIYYIGNEKDGKWMPMHGEKGLKGDKLSVCTKKHLPEKYMDVLVCMANGFREIPDNFDSCAQELKIDGEKIKQCAEGEEGTNLVVESYKYSIEKQARGCPTIFLAGEAYQKGRGETDFMREICSNFKTAKPATCLEIPEPTKIKVTMITDKRCPTCNTDRLTQNLKGVFPALEAEVFDYSDPKGKELYNELAAKGQNLLPMVIFGKDVEKDEGYQRISRFVIPVDDHRLLRVGAKFDPSKEICDNNIDDTGNGKVDCDDPDCKDELVCRKEEKNRLDLFVMSMCPYGVKAFDAMKEVLDAFKNDGLKFHVHYIANETEPGKFTSLNRDAEVAENKRQLCAMKYYPKNFWDYIWCRNKNIRSPEWKTCATGPIKADKIEKCSEGDEGTKLLSENIKTGNNMGIGASPTWIINNKHKASGIAPEDIKNHVCRHNPELKGCKATLSKGSGAPAGGCGS
jgi:hypothetical protein